jgi:hypothetical protein
MSIPDMTRHSRGSGVKFLAQAGRRTIAAPTQPKRLGCEGHAAPAKDAMAFSSEMDSGSRGETRQIKSLELRV